jgi:Delta3-Delta2-enoyl-CoA isomerase
MSIFRYKIDGNVVVLTMTEKENCFNDQFLKEFYQVLDEIEAKPEASVLILAASGEKVWSNGIDLEWIQAGAKEKGQQFWRETELELNRFYKRLLLFPMITIAAMTGHAFAGGAVLACTFDFRFMREDLGWFCFPEVDLKILFSPFFNALAGKAVPFHKLVEMQLTAKRMTATECLEHHLVDKIYPQETLVAEAVRFGKANHKDRATVGKMKALLYRNIVDLCEG